MTDKEDNQITGFYPGAMSKAPDYSLLDLKQKPDFVIISPNDPQAIIKLSQECRNLNIPFMIDIGMQLPALDQQQIRDTLKGAKILIGNDYEIDLLKTKASLTEADLFNEVEIIITTLGAKGSIIQTKDEKIEVSAAKTSQVFDPTGAGDAYRAGFICGFQKGLPLKTCGQMGAIASCYTIEKYGTTSHTFSKDVFRARYSENFQEELNI